MFGLARRRTAIAGIVLAGCLTMAGESFAEISHFTIGSIKELGEFNGRQYREVTGNLWGVAPGGEYSVPIELVYPASADDFNGFALVDVVNMSTIGDTLELLPWGGRPFPMRYLLYGDEFLFGSGYFYVSVLWDKERLETLGTGRIAEQQDYAEILRDVALLARDPSLIVLPPEIAPDRGAGYVIASGYSSSSGALNRFLYNGENTADGAPAFEGAIPGDGNGCGVTPNCEGPVTGGARVIVVNMEGSVMGGASVRRRGETEDYRVIEVAGVPHLPGEMIDMVSYGKADQVIPEARAVYRAALDNLRQWILGVSPPPSVYVDVTFEGEAPVVVRDADGNALGGLRLPHLAAPLGTYVGADAGATGRLAFGGVFTPFSEAELLSRYPTRDVYIAAVTTAVEDLVAARYILPAEAEAYIEAANAAGFWE